MKYLITGAAGFIGNAIAYRLAKERPGSEIIGVDNLNPYYDVRLKQSRLERLAEYKNFRFTKGDIADKAFLDEVFSHGPFDSVFHLAAQAGVRYSINHPEDYIQSNIVGFFNIVEACRRQKERFGSAPHLVFASSSSVYGEGNNVPYSTSDVTDTPVSLYAATKKSDELIGYSYSKLYALPMTGLRFFTVYGPMGRPDMAYFKFADKLRKGEPIEVYNNGDMLRDFTFVDDVVEGVLRVGDRMPKPNRFGVPFHVYNIGNNSPIQLLEFIDILEDSLIKEGIIAAKGKRILLPMQPGDVYQTCADVDELATDFGFRPTTKIEDGLAAFAAWYRTYSKNG